MNDDQAVAGTPRSRDHCESVQLGGQAAAASNTVQTQIKTDPTPSLDNDEDKQLLLVKFIQHNQPEEFVEVFKMFKAKDPNGEV